MALATNSTAGEIILSGDLAGSSDPLAPELTATGVVPGSYNLGNYVVDVKGRIVFAEDFSVVDVPFASDSAAGIGKVCHHLSVDEEGCVSVDIASETQFGRIQAGSNLKIDLNDTLCLDWSGMPIATDSSLGGVIVPVSGNINVDGSGNISIPIATTALGLAQVPGADELSIDGSGNLTFTNTIATTTTLGQVIVPTSGNIDVDGSGNISIPLATDSTVGVLRIAPADPDLAIDGAGELTNTYSFPIATTTTLGQVIVPTSGNIDVDGSGNISIPDCSTSSKGVAQAGTNMSITSGTLDIDKGTNSTIGLIQVPTADGLSIDGSGNVNYTPSSADPATTTTLGGVIVPTSGNIDVDGSGNISVPDATGASKGVIQSGNHVTLTAGVLDVDKAVSNTTYGVVRSADTDNITIVTGEINVGSNITQLNTDHTFTKTQSGSLNTLTPAASVTPDGSSYQFFKLTLNQTTTLNTPSSPITGTTYHIIVDLNGNTLNLASGYETSSLSTAVPVGITVISCYYNGSKFQTIIQPDFQ